MTLFDRVFNGSDEMFERAVKAIEEAEQKFELNTPVAFPDTAYFVPCIYAFTGIKVTKLGELKDAFYGAVKDMMLKEKRTESIFRSGIATAMSAEVIEVLHYLMEGTPYTGQYHGHLPDAEIRELGVPLVTGDLPGIALIIGPAPSDKEAIDLVKSYQAKGVFVFMVGDIIDQVVPKVTLDFKLRMLGLGPDISAAALAVSVAVRTAMIFGAIQPGDYEGMWKYCFERLNVCVNAFAPVSDQTVACGAGAIQLGFPVVTNETVNMWRVPRSLIIQEDVSKFVDTAIEARGIKIKVTNIDVPVSFSNAFEGEIIRKSNMRVEADGSRHPCFELVRTREAKDVEDHKIEVIGSDFDDIEEGGQICLAMVVDVAGKHMQPDFESVFERKFHNFINCLEGIMHTGQRDLIRVRVSKDAFDEGFRARHIGEVLYAKVKSDYAAVVDKCQVTIYTDEAQVAELKKAANEVYDKRDARLLSLTDEGVDVFYSCILCQSFSPSHVCIVTPERLGLCGAVSWLDAKATHELDPNGPCQRVTKDGVIDENVGSWEAVNDVVRKLSQGALERVTLYSIMEDPMTSCGCFECICGIEPFSNGVIICNREYPGMTPLGMTFAELASMTGGGVQTPGFMGHGKHYIASKKFMKAEGGIGRIVWMPKHLKEMVASKLDASAKQLYDIDNFTDMIADEDVAQDPETLMEFLSEKGHPALSMDPLM